MSISSVGGTAGGWGLMQMQAQAMRQAMFKQLDQDGNGSVNKGEVQSLAQNITQSTGQSIDVDKVFSAVDASGDGSIDQSEYDSTLEQFHNTMQHRGGLHGLRHHHSEASQSADDSSDPLLAMFQQMDQDGDGMISESELQAGLENLSQDSGTATDLSKLFSLLDANQDGFIDASEQAAVPQMLAQAGMEGQPSPGPPPVESPVDIAKAMFQQMDQDGDGQISQSEFQTGLQNLAQGSGTTTGDSQTTSQTASSATGQKNSSTSLTQRLLQDLILSMQNDAYFQDTFSQIGVKTYA